jgi:LacI family transcriptional regulator
MRDVAARAGVSLSTVSRVVGGSEIVQPELAARVRAAVEALGYRRDHLASTLRRADRQSASLGLVLEDVANPFFATLHRAVEEVARRRGVIAFAGSCDEDPERERELADAFATRGVDGLLIAPAGADQGYLARDREAGVALVFVDRPPAGIEGDAVLSDNRGGAAAAVAHLVAHGHERIAFLGDRPQIFTAAERLAGYRAASAAAGLPHAPELTRTGLADVESAAAATRALLEGPAPPTALFAAQNLVAVGALRALHGLGLQRRVALVGFDELLLADVVEPPLSVIAQDPAGIGREAAELLFARLEGDDAPPRRVVLPTKLLPRGSGELPSA